MTALFASIPWWMVVVQGIGVVAAVWGVLSFQQKTQRGIVAFQLVNHVLWMTHFLLLGAYAGCILNAIGIFRCIVFSLRGEHKWARHPAWYALFAALLVGAAAFSWWQGDGAAALLPMSAMLLTTVSLSLHDPFRVRALTFFGSPFWLTYNIINFSIPGIVTEIFAMTSIVIGILRHDLSRKPK